MLVHVALTDFMADGSGTVNSANELKQLCINLAFALSIRAGFDVLLAEQAKMEFQDDAGLDLEAFSTWFLTTFDFKDNRKSDGTVELKGLSGV